MYSCILANQSINSYIDNTTITIVVCFTGMANSSRQLTC